MECVIVKKDNAAYSGILLVNKFILVTTHLINCNENKIISVIQKQNEFFTSKNAYEIGKLQMQNIEGVLKYFSDISDYTNVVEDLSNLFTIHVLSFDQQSTMEEVKRLWHSQFENADESKHLKIADEIFVKVAPFGSRYLINSYAQGIISNNVSGILLTDCPTVFGCEGGLIFSKERGSPVGIVVSCMAGWKGEWTGLTMGITFDAIFHTTVKSKHVHNLENKAIISTRANINNCLVYIVAGSNWGTGICIDKSRAIFITNSHVIDNRQDVVINMQGVSSPAKILFKVPDSKHFDLAFLKCDAVFDNLEQIEFSDKDLIIGDPVYVSGFPLFSPNSDLSPTITKGHVSLVKDNAVITTCTVLPGSSGGALLNSKFQLVGIVTCNLKDATTNCSYPRVNMSIPIKAVRKILLQFLHTQDLKVLKNLYLDEDGKSGWAVSKL